MSSHHVQGSRFGFRILVTGLIWVTLTQCDVYDSALLTLTTPDGRGGGVAQCGNGRVDDDELCDDAITTGEGACPTDCSWEDPCAPRVLAGAGCQRQCVILPITTVVQGDGCCPPGSSAGVDSDCGACGDGIIGPAEACDPPESCTTPEQCSPVVACIRGTYVGDAEHCSARCSLAAERDCVDGDQCCPAGCNAASDSDCSASCGDGLVQTDVGETCEAGSADAPCPQSCDDGDPCTTDLTSGSPGNCNVQCVHAPIAAAADGDGCCPQGAHALNDDDCTPVCGNQVPEPGEACDPCPGSCDDSDPCTTDAAAGSANACSLVCSHEPKGPGAGDQCCPSGANANTDSDCAPFCGNGVTEPGEQCDGGSLCTAQCTDTDEARCLDADNTSAPQACKSCRCRSCTQLMLGCLRNANTTFATHCRAVIECGQVEDCIGDACYCGTSYNCYPPNGPCKDEIDDAAAAQNQSVQACTDSPSCSVYQATAIGECVQDDCSSECRH